MEINLQDMTIVVNGVTEDIYSLARKLSTKNVSQVSEILTETNDGLPRVLKTRALKMVLNEFVMIAKELPITTELLHRLNWYTEYSDYQLSKLFNTLANSGDTRFHENALTEKYKISFWILTLANAGNLKLEDSTIERLLNCKDEMVNFNEYNELLNPCLYDFDGSIDVIPDVDFSRVTFKSSTVVELRELADKYEINVPKRLNRAQLLEVIVQRLQEEERYEDAIYDKIKDLKVVSLQRFAKDNNVKASTELRKEAVIDFIVKAVANKQSTLRSNPYIDLYVLEEERFEMKPEYIRDIDSRYIYEFDEDGEIVSMSDVDDLQAQIVALRLAHEADKARLEELSAEENEEEIKESDFEYEERVKELERQIALLNAKENDENDQERLLAEQEERLRREFDERIRQLVENNSSETEETETVVVEEVIEEYYDEFGNLVQPEELESIVLEEVEEEDLTEEERARREAEFLARQAELEQREAEMEKEAELAAKEAELAQREAELQKELEHAQRMAELEARQAEMQREAEIAEKEAELARQAQLRETQVVEETETVVVEEVVEEINEEQPVEVLEEIVSEEYEFIEPAKEEAEEKVEETPVEPFTQVVTTTEITENENVELFNEEQRDPYDDLNPVETIIVNEGRIDEVSFVPYEEAQNFSQSSIKKSIDNLENVEAQHVYGQIYNETIERGNENVNRTVKQEVKQEVEEQHLMALEQQKTEELNNTTQTVVTTTTVVETITKGAPVQDVRLARFNLIESKIHALTSSGNSIEEENTVIIDQFNNYFINEEKPETNNTIVDQETGKLVEQDEEEMHVEIEETQIYADGVDYASLDPKQQKAQAKIEKLQKKKEKLQSYKTMKDSKLVKKHNNAKRMKVVKIVLLIVLLIVLYLFVVLAGIYAFENNMKLGVWAFDPAGKFASAHEKVLDVITFKNYDNVLEFTGKVYKVIYNFIDKFR